MNASGRHVRGAVALMLSLALVAVSPALAQDPPPPTAAPAEDADELSPEEETGPTPWQDTAAKVVDIFPIRLLGACATVVGFGAFLVSVPLVAPAGRMTAIRESWEYFVMGPVEYTFVRPIGEL